MFYYNNDDSATRTKSGYCKVNFSSEIKTVRDVVAFTADQSYITLHKNTMQLSTGYLVISRSLVYARSLATIPRDSLSYLSFLSLQSTIKTLSRQPANRCNVRDVSLHHFIRRHCVQ